ncbi:hypothetical protein [Cellulomonas aerilata]|uniref:Uncharacterized protein n=1 Tax=Cellulomonas aerilata TaxID=515326 RepID=A0A512DC97_9CELL|nr:hypothetical protein [Cellulomonas aerilata]GEO34112.1 hypothetical protein CAE01nite_18370 [Cellulomonas aerilata]
MSKETVTDAQIARALGLYAGMVDRVLTQPQRWLGLDDDPPPTAPFPARALDALRDRALGEVTPASPTWSDQPLQRRVDWWVTRIGISAGLAAATPRFAGALADRVPLQAALGASAAGLAVCATAREHGRTSPDQWVPLLSEVLFGRRLATAEPPVPAAAEAEHQLDADDAEDRTDDPPAVGRGRGAQRAARTVWRLARTFLGLQDLLDERPRGNLLTRAAGKLPVVGLAGGWLDERAAIRKAARRTASLLR